MLFLVIWRELKTLIVHESIMTQAEMYELFDNKEVYIIKTELI